MRDARKLMLAFGVAAIAACSEPANENNLAITDINNAAPGDIEALPPDESVDTSSDELANGADNADVNEADENSAENGD